jgi:ABC-2 type transport system permease protein
MFAIFKRDFVSYFTTPIGYVFMAIFLAVNGGLFSLMTLQSGAEATVSGYFSMVIIILAIVIPVLTMKSFAEEKKQKTEQLLMTAPVSIGKVVMGKFLSVYSIFSGTFILGTVFNFTVYHEFADSLYLWVVEDAKREGAITRWDVFSHFALSIIGPTIAVLLIGAAFAAIGIFISSLTENQLIALIGTIAILLGFMFIASFNDLIPFAPVREVLEWLSVYSRYGNFMYGVFDFAAIVYYISICFVFLFLTVRVYEKRRWA